MKDTGFGRFFEVILRIQETQKQKIWGSVPVNSDPIFDRSEEREISFEVEIDEKRRIRQRLCIYQKGQCFAVDIDIRTEDYLDRDESVFGGVFQTQIGLVSQIWRGDGRVSHWRVNFVCLVDFADFESDWVHFGVD